MPGFFKFLKGYTPAETAMSTWLGSGLFVPNQQELMEAYQNYTQSYKNFEDCHRLIFSHILSPINAVKLLRAVCLMQYTIQALGPLRNDGHCVPVDELELDDAQPIPSASLWLTIYLALLEAKPVLEGIQWWGKKTEENDARLKGHAPVSPKNHFDYDVENSGNQDSEAGTEYAQIPMTISNNSFSTPAGLHISPQPDLSSKTIDEIWQPPGQCIVGIHEAWTKSGISISDYCRDLIHLLDAYKVTETPAQTTIQAASGGDEQPQQQPIAVKAPTGPPPALKPVVVANIHPTGPPPSLRTPKNVQKEEGSPSADITSNDEYDAIF